MTQIIAIVNQKGGVGKTATAYNVAYCLATKAHLKTLLIDLDPSANANKAIYHHEPPSLTVRDIFIDKSKDPRGAIYKSFIDGDIIDNLFVMPSRINLSRVEQELVKRIKREQILKNQIYRLLSDSHQFDCILIDCSPALNELTINAVYAANLILIPISYEEDSLEGMTDLLETVNEVKEEDHFEYMLLRNGQDGRKETANAYIEEKLATFIQKGYVMKTIIRQDEEINKAKINKLPVNLFNPNARGSKDYLTLTAELIGADLIEGEIRYDA